MEIGKEIILGNIKYIENQKNNQTILTTFNKHTKRTINLIFNNSINMNDKDEDKLGDKLAFILTS